MAEQACEWSLYALECEAGSQSVGALIRPLDQHHSDSRIGRRWPVGIIMPQEPNDKSRITRTRGEAARMREALTLIAVGGCETFYGDRMNCRTDGSGRARDGFYGEDRWCPPCIAADALGRGVA